MAWNEMRFDKKAAAAAAAAAVTTTNQTNSTTNNNNTSSPSKRANRFESAETLRSIYERLESILKFLVKFDHSNMLNVHDYWFVETDEHAKLVVITDYSTGGSVRRLLDAAMSSSKSAAASGHGATRGRVKFQTSRRWINQSLYLLRYQTFYFNKFVYFCLINFLIHLRCLHNEGISLFQGAFSTETIFIQSCGVIKLAPALLTLQGVCVFDNGVIRAATSNNGPRIQLNDEFRVSQRLEKCLVNV